MMHLLVHLVEDITILGPVFLHNMFHFKRFMGVLKKYVHNCARPEVSISKGNGTEEVIEFCVDFIPDLKPIGVPESRHEGRLGGKQPILWTDILSLKHTTQFYTIQPWWLCILRNTRILYAPKTRGSLTPGLNLNTRRFRRLVASTSYK
jgi:hypothetical protein